MINVDIYSIHSTRLDFSNWPKGVFFLGVPPSPMSLGEANEIANRLKAGNLRR